MIIEINHPRLSSQQIRDASTQLPSSKFAPWYCAIWHQKQQCGQLCMVHVDRPFAAHTKFLVVIWLMEMSKLDDMNAKGPKESWVSALRLCLHISIEFRGVWGQRWWYRIKWFVCTSQVQLRFRTCQNHLLVQSSTKRQPRHPQSLRVFALKVRDRSRVKSWFYFCWCAQL